MKNIAFILSLYIMVLNVIPCIDLPHDNTLLRMENTQYSTHNTTNDFDHCSPFCSCYFCVTPIIHQANIIQLNSFLLTQEQLFEYHSSFFNSYIVSIWQPPKLS